MIVAGDSRWTIVGNRSGHVVYREGEFVGELGYEMGGGDTSMIIFGDQCRWTAPEARQMKPDEVRHLIRELARSIGAIDVANVATGVWERIQ